MDAEQGSGAAGAQEQTDRAAGSAAAGHAMPGATPVLGAADAAEGALPQDPTVQAWTAQIHEAASRRQRLRVRGDGSKAFLRTGQGPASRATAGLMASTASPATAAPSGHAPVAELDTRALQGISAYVPSELVVTARAGTPLRALQQRLAQAGQWLPFEPPLFAPSPAAGVHDAARVGAPSMTGGVVRGIGGGTVGGMVAAGLAGPGRWMAGSLRDYVLGATVLNGRGELLSFGGQVMKNVAGYDVARLMAGSMGTLGVVAEVSLKVLPLPAARATLRLECSEAEALRHCNEWAGQPLPLSASAWWDGVLVLRLAGAEAAVAAAQRRLGGELIDNPLADLFWAGLRDQADDFFDHCRSEVAAGATLWRLSLPPTTPALGLGGTQLIEWGGGLRWCCTREPAESLRAAAATAGGSARPWWLPPGAPLPASLMRAQPPAQVRLHAALYEAFDPAGVFAEGRAVLG